MLLCSAMVGACAFGGIWYLAICDAEVTIVGEDGVERRAAYGDLLINGTVVMCGDSMYAYRNKYEYGPLDGWWDNIDDGNQTNVYQVLYWYHRGVLGGDAFRIVRQPEVRN